jgi:histone acetyltransferase
MLTVNLGSKRKATEEPNTPSDIKRIKSSYSEEPDTENIPKAPNVIPFPEKASRPETFKL